MQYGLMILFLIFNLFHCTRPAFAHSKDHHSITVRLSSNPPTLDWNRATSGSGAAVIQNMMTGLFSYDENDQPVPNLVQSFKWSDEGKTLQLKLKKGVFWNDGKPLTAQDCADSFARLLDPTLNSPNASILFPLKNGKDYFYGKVKNFKEVGVQVKGPLELVLQLDEPRTNFLHVLTYWATFPIRKDHLEYGLGPYRLVDRTPDEIHLQSKSAAIQNLTFKVIPDGRKALEAYENHKVDYLLQVEDDLAKNQKGIEFTEDAKVVVLLHLNPGKVQTNTPDKRRAIIDSLSNLKLVDPDFPSRVPARSIIPPGIAGSATTFRPATPQHSIHLDGPLLLGYPQDQLSQSIAEQLQRLSTEVKLRIEPIQASTTRESQSAKRYDLILTIFGLDFADPDQLLASFLSQGTHDLFNFVSPELPALMAKARSNQNTLERAKLYAEAAAFLQDQAAIVAPLFYRRRAFLLSPDFKRSPHAKRGSPIIKDLH